MSVVVVVAVLLVGCFGSDDIVVGFVAVGLVYLVLFYLTLSLFESFVVVVGFEFDSILAVYCRLLA